MFAIANTFGITRNDVLVKENPMTAVSTFRQELEAAILERHCAHHPMTQKWAAGELGREALMGWGVEQLDQLTEKYGRLLGYR